MIYPLPISSRNPKIHNRGFTLIELLMVIAVIMILSGITFGITRGVQNAQSRAKAKVELATIAQALEQYKARYGDYPRHDSNSGDYPDSAGEVTSTMLLYALTGRLRVEPQASGNPTVTKISDSLNDTEVERAPKFIDITKFSYSGSDDEPEALIDPWGNPYIYWYKWENTPEQWELFGYHLYSMGPNGMDANDEIKTVLDTTDGILKTGNEKEFREVADAAGIIFAGQ